MTPLIHTPCHGALNPLLNPFLPTLKLARKDRVGSQGVRKDGETQTPLRRVRAGAEARPATQARLRAEQRTHNPFALTREVERQRKGIAAHRRPAPA